MYYLFIIKKDIYEIYKNKTYSLFKLLYNLYHLSNDDLKYGVTLFNQICTVVNIDKLKEYFSILNKIKIDKNTYRIIDNNETHLIILKPSHIIYKTDNISINLLYVISNYSKYVFICNFKEKEFFFLEEKL